MNRIVVVLIFLLFSSAIAEACTTAVISGKYTKDGRPLLWKNRDTDALKNRIMYFDDAQYAYMGLVNSADSTGKSIWIGMNETGFAIMNSASYNLNIGDTTELSGFEGRIMKEALATCVTVSDFEKYLSKLEKPTRLEANFGVIDASGGAMLFELSNYKYVRFDANDATVAPFGYIIRANYSFTGSFGEESSGYIRKNTTEELFYNALATNTFDAQFIMQDVTRSLKHSLLKTDLEEQYGAIPENRTTYSFFHDFIPRKSSSSACVVQGVKKGENPEFTTLWAAVGFPLASITIPLWLKSGNNFPRVLKIDNKLKDSPICNAALTLKKEVFPIRWGKFGSLYYINVNALINNDKTGILQKIKPDETKIFEIANAKLDRWKTEGLKTEEMIEFNEWLNNFVISSYKKNFNLDL